MAWPLASHFSAMLQNPAIAFRDPELKTCQIEMDANLQPRPRSGAFAVVYKGTLASGRPLAIRVFTSDKQERRERYEAISTYLQTRRLQSLVGFKYYDKEIRSAGDGKRYPLVTMEWVPGETLFDWVRAQCLRRNRTALAGAATGWLQVIRELNDAQIAHGDLQHANVMVTDTQQLKLVDYDCMCVPALVGRPNLEIGVDPYQLKDRNSDTPLSAQLDNYSALFILAALRALAALPDLWDTFVEKPRFPGEDKGYDKLLFRREDLDQPASSPLIKEVLRSPDPETRELVQRLVELADVKIAQVPFLHQVVNSFGRIEELLRGRKWDAAVELLERRGQWKDAPPNLQPLIADAQKRCQCRKELERAVAAGDEEAMGRLHDSKLLEGYPEAAPAVAVARKAPEVKKALEQLREKQGRQAWREFVALWDQKKGLLAGRKSADPFQALAEEWRPLNQLCSQVKSLLSQPACDLATLDAAWRNLQQRGGHPDLTDADRRRVAELLEVKEAWSTFAHLPQTATRQHDQARVDAWRDDLFTTWGPAAQHLKEVQEARQRLEVVRKLEQMAELTPRTAGGEQTLLKTAAPLGRKYGHGLEARLHQAVEGLRAAGELVKALQANPVSDLKVAGLWQELGQHDAQELIVVGPDSPAGRRIELACARFPVLSKLQQLAGVSAASQQMDERLLELWDADLLDGCEDARTWEKSYRAALQRKEAVASLAAAIHGRDDLAIAAAAEDPRLAGFTFANGWAATIKAARASVQPARDLLKALDEEDRARFVRVYNVQVLRQFERLFASHQELLLQWTGPGLLTCQELGLSQARGFASVARSSEKGKECLVRWAWPEARFGEECCLAICSTLPRAGEEPDQLRTIQHYWRVQRRLYEQGGGMQRIRVEDAWKGSYVVVWALIDLGFRKRSSSALVLGRLG